LLNKNPKTGTISGRIYEEIMIDNSPNLIKCTEIKAQEGQ
jgi:hypothetical protein